MMIGSQILFWNVDRFLETDLHTWHRNHQPLILTERFWQVQTLLERCMAGQDVRDVTSVDRDNLKQLYDQGIYFCRHPACEGYTQLKGFSSSGEREKHEARHCRPFVCSHPSCNHGWAKVGFTTKSGLNKHLRKYHKESHVAADGDAVNLESLDYILSKDGLQGTEYESSDRLKEKDNESSDEGGEDR